MSPWLPKKVLALLEAVAVQEALAVNTAGLLQHTALLGGLLWLHGSGTPRVQGSQHNSVEHGGFWHCVCGVVLHARR